MPDAVVIGGGHNGLVAANLLADRGLRVLVLEREPVAGGAVRSGELTVPGYVHDFGSAFYPLAAFSPIIASLGLEHHGLCWRRAPVTLAHVFGEGRGVVVGGSLADTAASLESDAPGDGERWAEMIRRFTAVRDSLARSLFSPFPPLKGPAGLVLRLGAANTLQLARDLLLPVGRMAKEWFEGEGASLLLAGCALHADIAPLAAGSGAFGWLLACLAQEVGFPVPEGGAGRIAEALVARLESRGGEVQCGRGVEKVIVTRGTAVGVRTEDGDEIEARRAVLAAVSAPHLYLELLEPAALPSGVLAAMRRFEWDPPTVKLDWALSGAVPWVFEGARQAATIHLAGGIDELVEYSADLATRRLPRRPFLLVGQQSVADRSRAPAGGHTLWCYTHVPSGARADGGGEIDASGADWVARFAERIESRIEAQAPGFGDLVVARQAHAPADLEAADRSLKEGALFGGTAQLHQQLLFRPPTGLGRPETPVSRLFLASASAHPGGGVHGGPGANAARAAVHGAAGPRAWLIRRAALTGPSLGAGADGR